jgi:hypothetical protein
MAAASLARVHLTGASGAESSAASWLMMADSHLDHNIEVVMRCKSTLTCVHFLHISRFVELHAKKKGPAEAGPVQGVFRPPISCTRARHGR